MKNSLVTGGAGFIGSHLVEALLARGDMVRAIDDESTGSIENLAAVRAHPHLHYVKGSVTDGPLLAQLTADVEEVYHLAAAVGVQLAAAEPVRTIRTNVLATDVLLKVLHGQARAHRPVKLFLASSSEVYGKNPKASWDEEDAAILGPVSRLRWSYGVSKFLDEFLALAYARQYALPVVVARFFNVVGPRQTGSYGMVLPRLIDAALNGQPPVVHDDGRQVRCFAYVTDVVEAVLALMACPAAVGRVFNVGSDQPVSIGELAGRVVQLIDPRLPLHFQSYVEAYGNDFEDCRRRVPDLSRVRQTIGWQPRHDLEQILQKVIAWRRKQLPPPASS